LAYSLNRGIHESRGKYIARMDADDVSLPDRLEHQINFLDNNPDFVLVGCNGFLMDENGFILSKLIRPLTKGEIKNYLSLGNSPFIHGSVVYKKHIVLPPLLYDENMNTIEDWDLWRRMHSYGEMTNLVDPLYKYRLTPTSITTLPKSQNIKRGAIINKIILGGILTDHDILELKSLKKDIGASKIHSTYNLRVGKALFENEWRPKIARKYFLRCLSIDPYCWNGWINLILTFFPIQIVRNWKNNRLKRTGGVVNY
jgi:glycosyltransferase involved in cell wall biosynthesis